MDTAQTTDCVEFCLGYGGNHLGLKRVIRGLRCIAASEIEAYAVANMVSKMEAGFLDPFPIWTDLRSFPCELFRGIVDILIASYPCQPFSSAGKRAGADDPRHLWPFVRRAIEIIRPRYVFLENVEGHVSLGLREVLTELALLGYRVENSRGEPTWGIFSAAEVGAPHNRKRVFILAEDGVVQDNAMREQNEWHNAVRLSSGIVRTGELAFTDRLGHIHEQSGIQPAEGRIDAQRDLAAGCGKVRGDGGFGVGQANPECDRLPERKRGDLGGVEQAQSCTGHSQAISSKNRGEERLGFPGGVPLPLDATGEGLQGTGRETEGLGCRCAGDGLAVASSEGQQGSELSRALRGWESSGPACELHSPLFWPSFVARPSEQQHSFEPPRIIGVKRGLGGGVNGRASNVDRLRLLGNGVYPYSATKAFITLYRRLIL